MPVASSCEHRCRCKVFGNGWEVVGGVEGGGNEHFFKRMLRVEGVDEPARGVDVKLYIVFGKVTKHLESNALALQLLASTCMALMDTKVFRY